MNVFEEAIKPKLDKIYLSKQEASSLYVSKQELQSLINGGSNDNGGDNDSL